MIENNDYEIRIREERESERRERFVKIWGFMLMDLKLEKTELLIYAVIFSMHRNYCDCFSGSREYLQSWSGASKSTVDKALLSLESKGLIHKQFRQYGNIKKAVYFINTDSLPTSEMFALENKHRDSKIQITRADKEA